MRISELRLPIDLQIENLMIKEDSDDLIILPKVYGGIGYYVSEKLKQEIEDAGCTGIEFTPAHKIWP